MLQLALTDDQRRLARAPVGEPRTIFLQGPAGCGKTTVAVHRMLHLMDSGVRADRLLVWVPQRSLGQPYIDALRSPTAPSGPRPDVLSIDGLARRMIDLFWTHIAGPAGFDPRHEPTFLTLETAQYFMTEVLEPFLDKGLFGGVTLSRGRLISQLLDNLNKAALVGFPYAEISERLEAAWNGVSSRVRVYEAVQEAANAFRAYCLGRNLLDFALQLETFSQCIRPLPVCRAYLMRRYRHVIADNMEEDVPVAHDLLKEWIAHADSALALYDQGGGFRTYLGADPEGALELARLCDQKVTLSSSFVNEASTLALGAALQSTAAVSREARATQARATWNLEGSLATIQEHFHTDMLRTVADAVAHLVDNDGVAPGKIAILAPFMDDALRYALTTRLDKSNVPTRSHRPSRALREESAVRCMLTLACLAHPHWEMCPPPGDVAQALVQALGDMDWVRASLLTSIVYRKRKHRPALSSFQQVRAEMQERITYVLGGRFEQLRDWLDAYQQDPVEALDLFWSRLFEELLSRKGFGFAGNLDGAAAIASLIESARKFRWVLAPQNLDDLNRRYISMVQEGVIAAQYFHGWRAPAAEAVFIGPAYTFLTENRPVDYQFWLNIGSPSWGRRIYQPLTHPFVLTRWWPFGRKWQEADEVSAGQMMLERVVLGLVRRCRKRVYLCASHLNPRGFEERGLLLAWLQRLLRRAEIDGV